jgi:hypothetical protein
MQVLLAARYYSASQRYSSLRGGGGGGGRPHPGDEGPEDVTHLQADHERTVRV